MQTRELLELSRKMNKVKLERYYTREHSLFYYEIDSNDNLNGNPLFPEWPKIKNVVIIKDKNSNNVATYHDLNEIDQVSQIFEDKISKDPKVIERIKKEFYRHFNVLKPYLDGEKELSSLKELEVYYNAWVGWWSPMSFTMFIPDRKNLPKNILDEAIKMREETQEYADALDKIFMQFFQKKYPKYSKFSHVLRPEEIFSLKKKDFSREQVKTFEKRLNEGYIIVNGEMDYPDKLNLLLDKYNLYIKGETISLSKYMSREHSLFYAHVWNEANRDLFDSNMSGTNIKNIAFVLNKNSVLDVYYDIKELDAVCDMIARGVAKDPKILDYIISKFYLYWNKILPYINGKKKIENTKELKEYYNNWVRWWDPMGYLFIMPDHQLIPKNLQEKALKVRVDTQEYSDEGDRVFLDFIDRKYPEYKNIANLIAPEEAFRINNLSKSDIEKIKSRKDGCALVTFNGKSKIIPSSQFKEEAKKYNIEIKETKQEKIKELKGLVASPGLVKGKVKLVLNKSDLSSIKQGDIMVTYATSPDYVPAMKKCAAIVTDEGGVVCHAAIVSRELKLPCIVGTKVATQTLKNNDFVEVDANKGIIKIIK